MFAVVDANNFFASCERVFRPDLANKPVVVLSSNDGCVVARSQEVRNLGIPMGEPYFKVKQLLKTNNVQIFSSNFRLYSDLSQRMLQLITSSVPRSEVYSVDEAFVDLSHLNQQQMKTWAKNLRHQIGQNLGLPVSIGIAPTKTLAKLASHQAKHTKTGVLLLTDGNTNQALQETPLDDIWGIGRRLAPKLNKAGLKTAADLAKISLSWANQQMGKKGEQTVLELNGKPQITLETDKKPPKSIMVSRSFGHKINAYYQIETAVANFVAKGAAKLRAHQMEVNAVALHLYGQAGEERVYLRVYAPISPASSNSSELTKLALDMLQQNYDGQVSYKKAGILLFNLAQPSGQLDMLRPATAEATKKQTLMRSLDIINKRYGEQTLYYAAESPKAHWRPQSALQSPDYTRSWLDLPLVY